MSVIFFVMLSERSQIPSRLERWGGVYRERVSHDALTEHVHVAENRMVREGEKT